MTFCFFFEDTNKNGNFIDDKTLLLDKTLVEEYMAQPEVDMTFEEFIAALKGEFADVKTEFTGGYDYSFIAMVKHNEGVSFDDDKDGKVTDAIVKVNGKDITKKCDGGYSLTVNPGAIVFTAAKTYTVSFDANGGKSTMADVTGISGEYTLPSNGFTAPEGKQFKAWSVGGTEKAVGSTINVTANTTVTAVWEDIEYNVTVTGGTASVGAGTPITKATMGTTVTLTAGAAPSGQMFDKWVVNGVVVADANSATTTFVMPAGNVTAGATYKNIPVVTYTVSFDANGGTGTMADVTGISGEYTLPENGFTAPDGKQFKAWSVDGNEKAVGDKITVTADTTVKAVWETLPAAPADYDILNGANSKWTQDSDGNISVRGSGEFSKFVDVKVDGKSVDEKYYTVKEGSTIVTLKPEYLNTLTAGKHTLEIVWTDGTADTTFTVDAKPENTDTKSPQTGDSSSIALWIALLFVSGFGVVATAVYGKKRKSAK